MAASMPLSVLLLLQAAVSVAVESGSGCSSGDPGMAESCFEDGEDGTSALQLRSPKTPPDQHVLDDIIENLRAEPGFMPSPNMFAARVRGTCHLDDPRDGGCPITSGKFQVGSTTGVYPGGATVCLDTTPYFFQVIKGDPDKLLYYFQGGGACWDKLSYTIKGGMCLKNSTLEPLEGVFNVSNPLNPYLNYTKIVVLYCSGDMHGGNTSYNWGPPGTEKVQLRGFNNGDAVLKWTLAQFPTLTSLVVSGASAGSLGLQLWASTVLRSFADRGADTTVIGDSFLGILWPPGEVQTSEAWLFRKYKMCNPALLSPAQMIKCKAHNLLLADMWVDAMGSFRNARFVNINSKADRVQILFERAFELTAEFNIRGAFMTPEQYYKAASLLLTEWNKQPNFMSYLVDGNQHCFTPFNYTYLATPLGKEASHGEPSLLDWLEAFPDPPKDIPKAVCLGKTKTVWPWKPAPRSTTYCASCLMAGNR